MRILQWPGRVNVARAVTPRAMWNSPEEHFSEDECLLGDSAYPCIQRLICPFTRRGRGNSGLSQHHLTINHCPSNVKIIIEHTIGILKARFASLRSFSVKFHNNEDIQEAYSWVRACVVHPNILLHDQEEAPTEAEIVRVLEAERMEREEHLRINRWQERLADDSCGRDNGRRGFSDNPYIRLQMLAMIQE